MKKLLIAVAILVAGIPYVQAKDDPAAQQILDAALRQEHFLQNASSPYALEADFTAQLNGPVQGHFSLRWQSKDHWRVRVDMGPYQQIEIRNGEMEYTVRNLDFTPIRIRDLLNLLHIEDDRAQLKAHKRRTRTENGIALDCVQAEDPHFPSESYEICDDAASSDFVSETKQFQSDPKAITRFSGYSDFSGQRDPSHLERLNDKQTVMTVIITSIQSSPFDSALLLPPKGAIERRKCPDLKVPAPIKETDLDFGLNDPGQDTRAMLALTVLPNGSVSDVHLIVSGGATIDNPALSAVRQWKFQPAMCGTEPVIYDITIDINFRRD